MNPQPLVNWEDFQRLPERPDTGKRYELHDGEVVLVPPASPLHIKLQKRIERLLELAAGDRGVVTIEFPYRPVVNLQYRFAGVAYIPKSEWDSLPPHEYPVYAPAIIVEVLSPSNSPAKVNRQRIMALSAGTQEFWVGDPEEGSVRVTDNHGANLYKAGDTIAVTVFEGVGIAVNDIFAV